ncbi:hypothetical protein K503DRAFT_87211 [Rhizopogon vinicolor AM-OR11-026]|uniref:F-box domain-containing protein n=1 Tax=Rhizopogon vinicolor AM-OR11-026 TaxID=1314800 RepID=A0A1B7MFM3_9AGAM|nr:hypothetical protein K503DRAFT_87211 [Rhizopogon vinicolor AM-OR11-026]
MTVTVEKKTELRVEFLSLPQELQCYILGFTPWRDILRFTSVCKAFHQTYMSSCELQYIVELGGQGLLPLPDINLGGHVPIPKRLQLLREKSRAWLRFDIHSSKTISIPKQYYGDQRRFINGHLFLWGYGQPKIFPILPEPLQHTIDRDWSRESLCPVDATIVSIDLDMSQNLVAVAYIIDDTLEIDDKKIYIDLGALDGDGIPPQAVGRTLFPSELLPICNYRGFILPTECRRLTISGKHIALCHCHDFLDHGWRLQIWDWQQSITSMHLQ